MDSKKKTRYSSLREGYAPGGAFSIYGALKGWNRATDPKVQCWCQQAINPQIQLPSEGTMFPIQLCASCRATIMKN